MRVSLPVMGSARLSFRIPLKVILLLLAVTVIFIITGSTISGYFITSSGVSYSARLTSFGSPEIRIESTGSYYNWVSLNFEALQATNIHFVDYAGTNTQNDKVLLSKYEVISLGLLTILIAVLVLRRYKK